MQGKIQSDQKEHISSELLIELEDDQWRHEYLL